jgi:hypothetical protein
MKQGHSSDADRSSTSLKNSPNFEVSKRSLPHSQQPATCPCPKPDQFSPCLASDFLKNPFWWFRPAMSVVSAACCQKFLWRADHSSRGVLPTVVRRLEWYRNRKNEKAAALFRLQRYKKINWHVLKGEMLAELGKKMSEFRLSPGCQRYLRTSGPLRSVDWYLVTDISVQPAGTIFTWQLTDRLSRNIGNWLRIYAA